MPPQQHATLHTYPHLSFLMPLVLVACVDMWWVDMWCSLCGCSLSRMSSSPFALSSLSLRSLVCPLRPSLARMSSGAVRALVLLSCRLPPLMLQASLDTTRVALAHTCSAPVSRCSCSSRLLVSRLSSLVSRVVGVLPDLSRLVLPRCIRALHALRRAQGL